MYSILKFEIRSFFFGSIGYLIMFLFLGVTGLFLWVFNTDFNIFNQGFAELHAFFAFVPWLLLFLISAVCMRSFAEEKKTGTLELLLIKPIANWKILLGKFFANVILICIMICFTAVYIYSVYQLANPVGAIDMGSIFGAYFGLFFLTLAYTAIGIFTSTTTTNQVVAFFTQCNSDLFIILWV